MFLHPLGVRTSRSATLVIEQGVNAPCTGGVALVGEHAVELVVAGLGRPALGRPVGDRQQTALAHPRPRRRATSRASSSASPTSISTWPPPRRFARLPRLQGRGQAKARLLRGPTRRRDSVMVYSGRCFCPSPGSTSSSSGSSRSTSQSSGALLCRRSASSSAGLLDHPFLRPSLGSSGSTGSSSIPARARVVFGGRQRRRLLVRRPGRFSPDVAEEVPAVLDRHELIPVGTMRRPRAASPTGLLAARGELQPIQRAVEQFAVNDPLASITSLLSSRTTHLTPPPSMHAAACSTIQRGPSLHA
ncbi:hypothetical protein SAMN02745121_00266 [Nannocystis exedens]|uniref:Uncharacterized protein n=1 Tax=Nannocystis exedens TaxID=54 RepID=A0A1I1STW1_9BACT|nr:hypothetical protein NAEX_08839 [Nannocystis exedens]SFD49885.1 hypothetical protein SAMN02745121_00266 [Nannocystis exedens]